MVLFALQTRRGPAYLREEALGGRQPAGLILEAGVDFSVSALQGLQERARVRGTWTEGQGRWPSSQASLWMAPACGSPRNIPSPLGFESSGPEPPASHTLHIAPAVLSRRYSSPCPRLLKATLSGPPVACLIPS